MFKPEKLTESMIIDRTGRGSPVLENEFVEDINH